MGNYKDMSLKEFANAATASNPELGAIGATLVNYYTGKTQGEFEDHEGDPGSGEQTALFLASAREIVMELIRRVQQLEREQ